MRPRDKPWRRGQVLSFMAALCDLAGQRSAAEGYMLELLSWVCFHDRDS